MKRIIILYGLEVDMNVIMKIKESEFDNVMKELKDVIVEHDIMIKIERDEEFDNGINKDDNIIINSQKE